jgi:hypothetical protein
LYNFLRHGSFSSLVCCYEKSILPSKDGAMSLLKCAKLSVLYRSEKLSKTSKRT